MDQEMRQRLELVTAASSASFDKAAQYDTAVVGIGYVGFFALWAGVSGDVPKWTALASVSLITLSLLTYIGWIIVQMLGRHVASEETKKLLAENDVFGDRFLDRWNGAVLKQQRVTTVMLRVWRPLFFLSFSAGVLGGALLSGAAGYGAVDKLISPKPPKPPCSVTSSAPQVRDR